MGIIETSEFRVINTIEDPNATPRIVIENTHSGKQLLITGKVLEAQYRIGDNFLLLVTEGNTFEEALYIYYLRSDLEVIDFLELSAMYASGILKVHSISNSNTVSFSFFDKDEHWTLEILPYPKFMFFDNHYPVKARMSILRRRWLRLKKS